MTVSAGQTRSTRVLVALAALALISGCGGGGGDGYYGYGAIAVNSQTRAAGIASQFSSQKDANSGALSQCSGPCSVVLEFSGPGTCGALARGINGSVGWASSAGKSQAESKAISSCQGVGGVGCTVLLSSCN